MPHLRHLAVGITAEEAWNRGVKDSLGEAFQRWDWAATRREPRALPHLSDVPLSSGWGASALAARWALNSGFCRATKMSRLINTSGLESVSCRARVGWGKLGACYGIKGFSGWVLLYAHLLIKARLGD